MTSYVLDPVHFQFNDDQISTDKLRGIHKYGPYLPLVVQEPCCAFVFPSGCSAYANRLYVALKNGIGCFRGVENTFRYKLSKERVFPIPVTGYSPSSMDRNSVIAKHYKEAILSWHETHRGDELQTPVLVVIGYSLGDDYDNQIIRQGVERNPKLLVIVVDPCADAIVRSHPFLRGRTPRLITFNKTAKNALEDGDVLRSVRSVMRRVSGDDPFSEMSA